MKQFYEDFKTPLVTVIILFAALFLYTKLAGPFPFFINSVQTNKTDLFSADGEGTATAIPDTATIDLGITQTATTVIDAQNKTNQTANKIINNIKKLGISETNIKTTNYSVNPNYSSGIEPMFIVRGGGQNITGYTVSQNLEIKVTPMDKINQVIDTATSGGANLVGGINFTFSDQLQKSLEDKATQEAVDNAKNKAQNLAGASGISLGKIVNVVESSNFPRPIMMGGGAAVNSTAEQTAPPTNVTPGQNTVTVDVVIYYETY